MTRRPSPEALREAPEAWLCQECGQRCSQPLVAPNPFAPEDDLHACPHCREVECLIGACVIDGCTTPPSAGTPGAHGYRYAWTSLGATERDQVECDNVFGVSR